ncbi:MAG: hypothetical protein KGQ26_10555 [Rhodospirillales bacterium]|nr:hypothetical protein [Rhodospirillales bacterium]
MALEKSPAFGGFGFMGFKNISPTKALRLIVSIAAGFVIVPVISNFFIAYATQLGWYDNPAKTVQIMLNFVGHPWFSWTGGALLGSAAGVWADSFLGKKENSTHEGISTAETMLRIERDQSTPHQWHDTTRKNIYLFFQIWNIKPSVLIKEYSGPTPKFDINIPELFPQPPNIDNTPEQLDTFFIVFDKPISYKRVYIESFGHKFPKYDAYANTNRTLILYLREQIPASVTTFEIHFKVLDPPKL